MKKTFQLTGYAQLRPLWMAIFSDIIGFSLLITVLPSLAEEYGVTPLVISMVSSVNGLFSFISAPIWGKLSDRLGRKPMLLLAQVGTIAGFIVLGFSKNLWMIGVSRIIDGIFGGNFPISKAVINDVVEPKNMARELTTFGVAHNVANLFGPALGGFMFTSFGLMGPGFVAAALAMLSFGATWFYLRESAPIKVNPESLKKPASSTISPERPQTDFENALPPTNHQSNPSTSQWYHNRALLLAVIIFGFQTFAFGILISNLAMFGIIKFSLNAQEMGIFLTVGAIFQILIRYTVYVPLLQKWGEYKMAVVGFSIYLVELILLAFVFREWHLLVLLIANSMATSGTRGGLSSFVSNLVHPSERGKVQGILSSLDTFSQIIGPLLGGAMLTYFAPMWFPSISWVFMAIALISLVSAKPLHHALHAKNVRIPQKLLL